MDIREQLQQFAAYNRWANQRLYSNAAAVPDADYRRNLGLFFKSLHGTLNHLVVTDREWMRRFEGGGHQADYVLDAILYDALPDLTAARQAEDERIIAFVAKLDDPARTIRYVNSSGKQHEQRLGEAMFHFFTHQAHHRGQAHAALTILGIREPSPLDLLFFQRSLAAA